MTPQQEQKLVQTLNQMAGQLAGLTLVMAAFPDKSGVDRQAVLKAIGNLSPVGGDAEFVSDFRSAAQKQVEAVLR